VALGASKFDYVAGLITHTEANSPTTRWAGKMHGKTEDFLSRYRSIDDDRRIFVARNPAVYGILEASIFPEEACAFGPFSTPILSVGEMNSQQAEPLKAPIAGAGPIITGNPSSNLVG